MLKAEDASPLHWKLILKTPDKPSLEVRQLIYIPRVLGGSDTTNTEKS